MTRWIVKAFAALAAVILAAGCSSAPNRTDVVMPSEEGGSTLVGNPASLKAQNLAVAVKIIQQLAANIAPAAGPVVAGQFTLTWDPPPTPPVAYRVERKIGAGGAWAAIADVSASVRSATDIGELGATHTFRVVSFDAAGNSGTSDEASGRIPTFCDYPSGWSMVWPVHGCAPFEGAFALNAGTVFLAGPQLFVRRHLDDAEGLFAIPYDSNDIVRIHTAFTVTDFDPDVVLRDVCAVDEAHVFAVGTAQAPREKPHGVAVSIVDGVAKRIDLAGIERGPLLRVFCDSAERFSAVGARGTALSCTPESCAPIDGVDDPRLDRDYAAIWGVPGEGAVTGATLGSLIVMRPESSPKPLSSAAGADDRDLAVVDIWGQKVEAESGREEYGLIVATERGLFHTRDGGLKKIDDGRWRRVWGTSLTDFYAVGDGIAHFLAAPSGRLEKTAEGPSHEFVSIHGTAPADFFVLDRSGQVFHGDGRGRFTPRFNVWNMLLLPSPVPSQRQFFSIESMAWISGIAPAGSGRLAVSFGGAGGGQREGLMLYADGAMQPFPGFRGIDVFQLAPSKEGTLIASSAGLFLMDASGKAAVKLADGRFSSAWDCGGEGICAVRAAPGSADEIVLVRAGGQPEAQRIAPPYGSARFEQAWGSPNSGLFATVRRIQNGRMSDRLVAFEKIIWKAVPLPAPPAGTEDVQLRIVSDPPLSKAAEATPDGANSDRSPLHALLPRVSLERPTLLARYTAGREVAYALIAFQDGRWSKIERGDHLRSLVRISAAGERTFGIPDEPFETTAFGATSATDLWAVGDGKFLFRKTE